MDALAPPREQLRKFEFDAATLDQRRNQQAYRRISQTEHLRRRDDITEEQFRAAEKLNMHNLGAQGVRIQHDEECTLNPDTEYPITYHNQKLEQARQAVGNTRIWQDMIALVEESKTLVEIGKGRGRTSHPVARAYALGRITSGLDTLVDHWGLSTARSQKVP